MGRIEFDFYTTTKQANRLAEIADEIENISSKKLGSALKDVSYGWKSQTASEFIGKGNIVQSKIQTTSNDLMKVSQNIKRVAQRVYQAELRAKEIAEKRTAR